MKRFHVLPMTFAVLSLIVVCGLATSAFARPRGLGHDRDRLAILDINIDSHGLDDAAQAKIHTTIDAAQAEQSRIRDQLREEYTGLRGLMRQEPTDNQAVSTKLDTIGALKSEY